jgi:hypothetical protein
MTRFGSQRHTHTHTKQKKKLSSVNSMVISKHRKVENICEISLRAALKVTLIIRKHDVTLKQEVPPLLCFRTTKLGNQCVTNSSDSLRSFGMLGYAVLCKKDKGRPMPSYADREGR